MAFGIDPAILDRLRTFDDYRQAEDEFQLKKQLAGQQLLVGQAQLAKALKPEEFDIAKVGQQAFVKASQGMQLSPTENAALQYLDNKEQTTTFNPATGAVEQRPSLLQRAGLALPAKQTSAQSTPMIQALSAANATPVKPFVDTTGVGVGTNKPGAVFESVTNPRDEQMKAELARAAGNPKLQQTIKEKYVNANSPTVIFDQENKLRDEFNGLTKDFRSVSDAYNKIQGTSDSAAGDMSLLYQYNKLLDPGSVVRESEFAAAARSGSLGERLQNVVSQLESGERLTPNQRRAFKSEADNIYQGQRVGYDKTVDNYKGISSRGGLNSQNVITDYITPVKPVNASTIGNIPSKAVAALQKDPSKAAQFDAKYGQGASSQILGK
jgi:hypothetical protein